jgi:DNA-binding MarR family transcriptional regulator
MATDELPTVLRASVMRLARRLRNERHSDLPVGQMTALAALDRQGPLTPGELADLEHVSAPSMTRVIAALESRELLTRTPHPTDRRQQVLDVTPRARELLRADRARRDAWLTCRLVDLPDEDRELLERAVPVLQKLAAG